MMQLHWMLRRFLAEATDGLEGGASVSSFMDEAPAATDSVEESIDSDSINWGELAAAHDRDDEGEGDTVVVEAEPEPAEEEPPAPKKAKKAEAASTEEAPEPEPAPVVAETPPTPATTDVPKEIVPPTPAPTTTPADYAAWRTAKVTQLESEYALDEASAQALLTEPELVLPKLAAKVHMEVLEHSMQAMQAMMPVMMQQIQQHTASETQARSLFASINPDLADPSYEAAIMQFGQVYRKVNPTAPAVEASKAIGNLVRAALGIVAPMAEPPASQPAVAVAPTPFTPARGAGGGRAPVVSGNMFEQLATEFLMDED